MKYITVLQYENKELKARAESAKTKMDNLVKYLNSPKFHCGDTLDGYVNVQDVLDVLRDIRTDLI